MEGGANNPVRGPSPGPRTGLGANQPTEESSVLFRTPSEMGQGVLASQPFGFRKFDIASLYRPVCIMHPYIAHELLLRVHQLVVDDPLRARFELVAARVQHARLALDDEVVAVPDQCTNGDIDEHARTNGALH